MRARKQLNEEEAQILQLLKNADLFIYIYTIAVKARIDNDDDNKEFMKKLWQLLIAFKNRHRNNKANVTAIHDEPGGSSNPTKRETKEKQRKDGKKVSKFKYDIRMQLMSYI